MQFEEKLREPFCSYNCLDLNHTKLLPSVCYLFFQFSLAGTVSWKGQKFSAFGLKLAQPFSTLLSCSQELGKHPWKKISHSKSRQLEQQNTTPDFTACKQGLDFTDKIPISIAQCNVRRTWNRFSTPTYICRHYCVLRF